MRKLFGIPYDAQYISHALCRTHGWPGTPLLDVRSTPESTAHSCVKRGGPVSVSTAHVITDRIKDHKLMLATRDKGDRIRQQITKLGHCVKARSDAVKTAPVVRLCSDQINSSPTGSHRMYATSSRQSSVAPVLRLTTSKPSRTTLRFETLRCCCSRHVLRRC
jgi:hypothetical protein